MKKLILCVLLASTLLLTTACGKEETDDKKDDNKVATLTCTKTETDEDGLKTTETMEVKSKDNKVTSVNGTSEIEVEPSMQEFTYNFGNAFAGTLNAIDGIKVEYSKQGNNIIKTTMEIDYSKLDATKLKEALGGESYEDSVYSAKDMTLDDFKTKLLEGYTCE